MKIDFYTKTVLTVIALSLSVIASQHVISPAFAQNNGVVKVAICDIQSPDFCAQVVGRYGDQRGFFTWSPR